MYEYNAKVFQVFIYMLVDLHSHSTASDGSCSPSELARAFAVNGVGIAALTDHDTVGGVDEFLKACDEEGIIGIGGIEFSTVHRGIEVHLLGYGLQMDDPRCSGFLEAHHAYLRERLIQILEKLKDFEYNLSIEEIYETSCGNPPMPPHILRVLVNHGYINDLEGALRFYNDYLVFGSLAWVDHETPLQKPLNMLIETGAIAIVAHPCRLPDLGWLTDILDMGAHGFELYYPEHDDYLMRELEVIAGKRGCVITGGSDYHGAFSERKINEAEVPLEIGIKLLEAVGQTVPSSLSGKGRG